MSDPRSAGRPRVVAIRPRRTWARPGAAVRLDIELTTPIACRTRLVVELLDVRSTAVRVEHEIRLRPGRSRRSISLSLPAMPRRGYGLRASLEDGARRRWVEGPPIEALDGWWESPRHAAIIDYSDRVHSAATMARLRDWHVTVVQLYDWMYRHYRYRPPAGSTFIDSLGRRVSHEAMAAGVAAGHRIGIASLAYGSVYGAEREYVDAHPDERVFDPEGAPISLGDTFFINDPRPGRPWRHRLLREYRRALLRFAFDGIHMDTYGPPHHAVGVDGGAIDFAAEYPGLIAEAAGVVAAARPGARVLFNCVEGFPLDAVGSAPAAALYLELWPPDTRYRDIVGWFDHAAVVAAGRAVVIAAYLSVLRTHEFDPTARPGAIEAALLLTSIIGAAGAYHHVLAAGDRLLVEGYYPEARPLRRAERADLLAVWSFHARYVHLLSDPARTPIDAEAFGILDQDGRPVPTSASPTAGAVWIRVTSTPEGVVVQAIDLLAQAADTWDAIRQPSPWRRGWRLVHADDHSVDGSAMSPWTHHGAASRVAGGALPVFRRWLVVRLHDPSAWTARGQIGDAT